MSLPAPVYADEYTKSTQTDFKGYNHNRGAGDGAIYEMENLSGREYPLLSPRLPRALVQTLTAPNGMIASDSDNDPLSWVDGADFYYDGVIKGTVTDTRKTLVRMGVLILIFPDKAYYDTLTDTFGSLENSYTSAAGEIVFMDGEIYGESAVQNTIRSTVLTAFDGFSVGDAVEITGSSIAYNNKTPIVREIAKDAQYAYLRFYEGIFENGTSSTAVTFARTVPELAFAFVNENRLWGCSGDSVYASKLGDPFNFYVFDRLSTDAWSVEVLSSGDFTGACSFLGYPCFFKRDYIYKVYGTIPSDYQLMSAATLGVMPGSGESLSVAGETLYYLSRAGMVSYNGGLPRSIAGAFGGVPYHSAVAGTDGLRYYVSMQDAGGSNLFVFDTQTQMWHREDDLNVISFTWADTSDGRGGLYALTAVGDILCLTDAPTDSEIEDAVEWSFESTDYTRADPNRKLTSRLEARLELEEGASITFSISFDGGAYIQIRTINTVGKHSFLFPVVPHRCDHFKIKAAGVGMVRLYSLSQVAQTGSEIH